MSIDTPSNPLADAHPTKRFFVNMLTRDIELGDAILDLLDNCIDGALRVNARVAPHNPDTPYDQFYAEINLDRDSFTLTDNCGGMSFELAEKYAFRFGRPDNDRDEDIPTVGVYGIGMKRAIFKLGTNCTIRSRHLDDQFEVHIEQDWLNDDTTWTLPIKRVAPDGASDGVSIHVTGLHPHISNSFDAQQGNFGEHLRALVRTHYAFIIRKGFKVLINGSEVVPAEFKTLVDFSNTPNRILPYIYETEYDGVKIQLVLGMYERFPDDSELSEIEQGTRSKHTAGWTVLCNDRVVVSHDTSRLTGWGDAGVPAYHSQFVTISGIVTFTSNDATKLPVTTTKRGIDQNSEIYASVKDIMREALKVFTGFTNKWKSQTQERSSIQSNVQSLAIRDVATAIPAEAWTDVRKSLRGRKFVPSLPTPKQDKTHQRIVFMRRLEEIKAVRSFLFDDDATPKPSEVGEAAFDYVLSEAK